MPLWTLYLRTKLVMKAFTKSCHKFGRETFYELNKKLTVVVCLDGSVVNIAVVRPEGLKLEVEKCTSGGCT